MKELHPVTFIKGDNKDTEFTKDYRAVVEEDGPKVSYVTESVNESPPENKPRHNLELDDSEKLSIPLVSPSELKNSLQENSDENASAEKEQNESP